MDEIYARLLFPRTLGRTDEYNQLNIPSLRRIVLSSFGCLSIAFRRAYIPEAIVKKGSLSEKTYTDFWLSSPYIQIEVSMCAERGLPIMHLVESGVSTNSVFGGVLESGATTSNPYLTFVLQADGSFFDGVEWREVFADWVGQVRSGYTIQTEPEFKYI